MNNLKDKIMIIIFVAFLALFSAGSFLYANKDFSENENRKLQEFPEISGELLLDGNFAADMESYVSDRLTFRESLIGFKNYIIKLSGTKDAGGVYFCNDDYYIEKKTEADVDENIYLRNLKAINLFYGKMEENGISPNKLSFMGVPTASTVLKDKLPANSSVFDELAVIEDAENILFDYNVIDVTESVADVTYPYYKTDHHWTMDSAYAAYVDWCISTGRIAQNVDAFEVKEVSNTFRGTLYSKVLCPDAAFDVVKLYIPEQENEYKVICDGKEKVLKHGFWDSSYEHKKDVYAGFYGGNYATVHIAKSGGEQAVSEKGREKLLVIKDSYANCFVPFLYGHFDDIYIVDLRFFNENLVDFCEKNSITEVLSLFNISTFVEEKSIGKAGVF